MTNWTHCCQDKYIYSNFLMIFILNNLIHNKFNHVPIKCVIIFCFPFLSPLWASVSALFLDVTNFVTIVASFQWPSPTISLLCFPSADVLRAPTSRSSRSRSTYIAAFARSICAFVLAPTS